MPVRVDLPIPGAPPRRTSDPGTRPPPSTRSSSATPVTRRGTAGAATSRSGTAFGAGARRPPPPRPRRLAVAGSWRDSTRVFHSPHPAQRPDQASASCPHDWHRYLEVERAIAPPYEPRPTPSRPGALEPARRRRAAGRFAAGVRRGGRQAGRGSAVIMAVAVAVLVVTARASAFDAVTEAKNFAKIDERERYVTATPEFQARLLQ